MNDVFKVFLSLSFSGFLLILVLLVCKHIWKNKMSRQWQYYIWLIVLARLLFPVAPETNLIGSMIQTIHQTILPTDTIPSGQQGQIHFQNIESNPASTTKQNNEAESKQPIQEIITLLVHNLWLVWLGTALIILIRKITVYQSFVHYIKAGQIFISDIELLDRLSVLAGQIGIKRSVELCMNPLVSSPLLIGFFHPYIVLPNTNLSEKDFQYTILHELTHFKRMDMFFKWLVQITVCLHWFNPLVYLMRQEINKACEFSCDEAMIAKLNFNDAQEYGKTLLNAMLNSRHYKESLPSVSLSENKELLKERLGAIMNFKKKSKWVMGLTLILTLVICCGAAYIGVYAAPSATQSVTSSADAVKVNFSDVSITAQGPVGVELVRTSSSNVTFELLNMDNEENCTTKAEIINDMMQITITNYVPNGINVNFGPDYKNVVRVYIPDAVYNNFDIKSKEMVIQMQDFNASVHVESSRAGFWLIDTTISKGTYHINVFSGPIYIEADTILSDITANAKSGPVTVLFHKEPANLFLDSAKCGPVINRPEYWPAVYKVGTETPKIILSNTGKATIEVQANKNDSIESDRITPEQADEMALELTNRIWVWEWVEFFVPYMSEDGVNQIISTSISSKWADFVKSVTGKSLQFTKKQIDLARNQTPEKVYLTKADIDAHAQRILQANRQWKCIDFMLSYMTENGIKNLQDIYTKNTAAK